MRPLLLDNARGVDYHIGVGHSPSSEATSHRKEQMK